MTTRRLMRSNSKGLAGTIEGVDDHTPDFMKILVRLLEQLGTKLGFEFWDEAKTVHKFTTYDGRALTIRGITDGNNYIGARLSLYVSRSTEIPLFEIRDLEDGMKLFDIMRQFALPHFGVTWAENGRKKLSFNEQ